MGFYVPHKDADWEMNDNSEFYNYQGELKFIHQKVQKSYYL